MPTIKIHDCNCQGKAVDLEIENRNLKARNAQLEFDLAQANARINQLLNENTQLGSQLPSAIGSVEGQVSALQNTANNIFADTQDTKDMVDAIKVVTDSLQVISEEETVAIVEEALQHEEE